MGNQFDNVSVVKKANVYFDGKCVSHTVLLADGSRKSVGVIFPSRLTFETAAPEIMEIVGGACRVKVAGGDEWKEYRGGQRFEVAARSSFEIETTEMLDYVCHFG
jgi:uncharacterized protein YaiE (UPF0345 family)